MSGLLHHWSFDEGAGTTAADSVGGATASLQNNATWVAGRCGGALFVDGIAGYAVASTALGTGAVTVTIWVYAEGDGSSGYGTVVSEEDLGGNTLFDCVRDHPGAADNLLCADSSGVPPFAVSAAPVTIGHWIHLGVTRTAAGAFTIYFDGVASGPTQDGGPPVAGGVTVYIGARDDLNERFKGGIDDARVYDHALDASEIAAVFAAGC